MSTSLDDRRNEVDELRRLLADPVAVCQALGLSDGAKKQGRGLLVLCPAHAERDPSCSVIVTDGTIQVKCHACPLAGDVFSLIAASLRVNVRTEFPRVLKQAREIAGVSAPDGPSRVIRDYDAEWSTLPAVDEACWDYLRDRGLDGAADHCRSLTPDCPRDLGGFAAGGYRLALAIRNASGRVVAIQARHLTNTGKNDRFKLAGPSGAGVFGEPEKIPTAKQVLLCEGFTDTLAALHAFAGDAETAVVGIAGVGNRSGFLALPITGKRVIVAIDADERSDEHMGKLAAELDKRGPWLRARPEGGKDLCDMLTAGVDLRQFVADAVSRASGFQSFAARIIVEWESRLADAPRILPFGVRFLDCAFGGMLPADIVIVGGRVGRGKSELLSIVGASTAAAGRHVYGFFLEAEKFEQERRIKYRLLSSMLYSDDRVHYVDRSRMNYQDWRHGKLVDLVGGYERVANEMLAERYRTLHTYYRGGKFTARDLDRICQHIDDHAALLLIDHLHFIDSDEQNDQRAMKGVVWTVYEIARKRGIPIVAVAHLRKSDRKAKQLVPDEEDWSGAAVISQIAHKGIMLAPADDFPTTEPHLANTYLRIVKNRVESSRCVTGLVEFNRRTNTYASGFKAGHLVAGGTKFEAFSPPPQWANPPRWNPTREPGSDDE